VRFGYEIAEKINARISFMLAGMGKLLSLIRPNCRTSYAKKGMNSKVPGPRVKSGAGALGATTQPEISPARPPVRLREDTLKRISRKK
jgi:hypothetical protein